jgi:hypothetical protein
LSSLNDASSALKKLDAARLNALREFNARKIVPNSKELMDTLSKMESELNTAMQKLDTFGKYKALGERPSRRAPRYSATDLEKLTPTPPSSKSRRNYNPS